MSAVLPSPGKLRALKLERLALLEEQYRRLMGNRLDRYRPYPKQREFHAAGLAFRERLLKAGNQLGKTLSAANETAMHLTGRYPPWWRGRTWDRGVSGWAAGVTNEVTRDSLQLLLCGDISKGRRDNMGTGTIPRSAIKDFSMRRGIDDAIDSILVRHGGGGDVQPEDSVIGIKSYEQGRTKFQAATLDFVWLDEEPELEIYTECLTRTNATAGVVFITFTPLMGMTATVKRFMIDKPAGSTVITMTIHDAEHYTPEQRAAIIASYPAHEREARVNGVPTLGSGRIYPIADEAITVQPFAIPGHWVQINGIDFGWTHPMAAVNLAWDREADVIYVTKAARRAEVIPLLFAAEVKPWGAWIPWAWPSDGLQQTSSNAGIPIADQFRDHGLAMLERFATHAPVPNERGEEIEGTGGTSVDAGILELLDRMQTNRFKVFANLNDWFDEFRMYHREDGKVVKLDDDLLDATRYAVMMKRHAITRPAPMKAFDYGRRGLLA